MSKKPRHRRQCKSTSGCPNQAVYALQWHSHVERTGRLRCLQLRTKPHICQSCLDNWTAKATSQGLTAKEYIFTDPYECRKKSIEVSEKFGWQARVFYVNPKAWKEVNMLYNLVKKYRGKETVVMTDEFKLVNDKKAQLLLSQRKGVKGQRVQYTVREALPEDEKEPFVPHAYNPSGGPSKHPRVPKEQRKKK